MFASSSKRWWVVTKYAEQVARVPKRTKRRGNSDGRDKEDAS